MRFNWHCSLVMVTFNICTSCLRIQEGILPERMAQLKGQAGIQTGTGEIRDVSEFLVIFRFTPRAAHWFSACLSLSPNRFPISFIGLLPCQPCCEGLVLLTTEVFKATDLKLPIGFPHTPAALCQHFTWIEIRHEKVTDGANIKILFDCVQDLLPPGSYWTLMNWNIACMYKIRCI